MRLEDKRIEAWTGRDSRRRARAGDRARGRGRRGQGIREGVRAGAGEGGAAGQPGVGRGGDHRRCDRTGRGPGRARGREGHRRVDVGLLADLVLPAGGGRARGAAGQRPRREERPGPGEDEDKLDAVWLAKLTEKGLLRPSFVPPTEIRRLRDYTRLRADLTHDRSRQVQRLEKLLEDALVKLSTVATDIMGVSGRAMIEALIAGQRDAKVLAGLARGRMKTKRAALIEALSGRFDDHHAELARMLLDQIDALTAQIDTLTARIEQLLAAMPEAQPVDPRRDGPTSGHPVGVTADTLAECARLTTVERLDEIAGIGEHNAQVIIAEIGLDMSRFPTPAHLVSWAKLCPRTIQSGPVTRGGRTGKGNPYLKGVLGDAAAAAAKTSTFLGERYRRIVKRRGKLKALVAVARSILVIVWNLLNDPTARFHDLGPD